MSIILQTNPKEKRARLRQLLSWGYITQQEANEMYHEYLRLFKRVNGDKRLFNNITVGNMLRLVGLVFAALC